MVIRGTIFSLPSLPGPCSREPMTFEFFEALDTGRARTKNEDSVSLDESVGLAVLADGMGGYNAGEVASSMATSFIRSELGRWLREATDSATDAPIGNTRRG